jgi:hypothetical protein
VRYESGITVVVRGCHNIILSISQKLSNRVLSGLYTVEGHTSNAVKKLSRGTFRPAGMILLAVDAARNIRAMKTATTTATNPK